jgi:site-specific recombinase XerD
VSELIGIGMDDLWLDQGLLKVMCKGGKERLIPIGCEVRVLCHHINRDNPRQLNERFDFFFMTRNKGGDDQGPY